MLKYFCIRTNGYCFKICKKWCVFIGAPGITYTLTMSGARNGNYNGMGSYKKYLIRNTNFLFKSHSNYIFSISANMQVKKYSIFHSISVFLPIVVRCFKNSEIRNCIKYSKYLIS